MPIRRLGLAALAAALLAPAAQAHHGILFTADRQIRITGEVVKELTGFPHFEIKVQDGDVRWAVDLGNPYRMKKAGLTRNGSDMPRGKTVTVQGFPALDSSMKIIQARTIEFDGKEHVLFDEEEPKY